MLALPLICSVCGGHCAKAPGTISTGYGLTGQGERVCYPCCAVRDIEDMKREGKITLYLTRNRNYCAPTVGMVGKGGAPYYVTNWPGSLKIPVYGIKQSFHNFAGRNGRADFWFNGPDGFLWHGVNIGDNEIARCKRTKEEAR